MSDIGQWIAPHNAHVREYKADQTAKLAKALIGSAPEGGYAYASSARFPRDPDTVCFHADWCARYRFVGYAQIDGFMMRAFRLQGSAPLSDSTGKRGPRYLFQLHTEWA